MKHDQIIILNDTGPAFLDSFFLIFSFTIFSNNENAI